MDLKDILKGSRFEKYTEDFHNKGVFTVEEYYKSINSGISDVITDEKERMFFSFFMTEKTIIEPNQTQPLPSAPKKDQVEEKKLNNLIPLLKWPDNIKDFIDFLKSDDNIVMKVEACEIWDGYCQLKSDIPSDNVKNERKWDDEDFDFKKPVYEDEIYIWAEGEICDFKEFITMLQDFLSRNEGETVDEFLDDVYSYLPQDADEAIWTFGKVINEKIGCGFSQGVDDCSWYTTIEINHGADISISFFKKPH